MECKHKHTQESVQKIFSDGGCELVGECELPTTLKGRGFLSNQ